jgi:hypothetical protein
VFCELPNDESGTGGPLWPFVPEQVPPSNELAIPKDPAPGRNPWSGALFKKRATRYVKYDVIVTLPTGETVMLDPVIIIEK